MFLRFLLHRRHHDIGEKELAMPITLIHKSDAAAAKATRSDVTGV